MVIITKTLFSLSLSSDDTTEVDMPGVELRDFSHYEFQTPMFSIEKKVTSC